MTAFRLHSDENFHYEAIRSLGTARYYGSDIGETLNVLPRIRAGDFDSWYDEWSALSKRVLASIDTDNLAAYDDVTVRNVYFRASHYCFMSEFFLHHHWDDSRSLEAFHLWRKYFDIANAHLDIPGKHVRVKAEFGEVPFIVYRTAKASKENPRPLIILGGGFDSNYEETLHDFGFDALERGYNVIIYEGPGQPNFLHDQHVGFIHDWEKAVTPIVDYIFEHSEDELAFVDPNKVGLLGMSLGGYLAARAAAFEPRLAAVICIDGVWSFFDASIQLLPEVHDAWRAGDEEKFNVEFEKTGEVHKSSGQRWVHDHVKLALQEESGFKCFQRMKKMTLDDGVAERIKMPAFIGDAQKDLFFQGQPEKVAKAIGDNATLFKFTDENAAAAHCASGALNYQNQVIFEWFGKIVSSRR